MVVKRGEEIFSRGRARAVARKYIRTERRGGRRAGESEKIFTIIYLNLILKTVALFLFILYNTPELVGERI